MVLPYVIGMQQISQSLNVDKVGLVTPGICGLFGELGNKTVISRKRKLCSL